MYFFFVLFWLNPPNPCILISVTQPENLLFILVVFSGLIKLQQRGRTHYSTVFTHSVVLLVRNKWILIVKRRCCRNEDRQTWSEPFESRFIDTTVQSQSMVAHTAAWPAWDSDTHTHTHACTYMRTHKPIHFQVSGLIGELMSTNLFTALFFNCLIDGRNSLKSD